MLGLIRKSLLGRLAGFSLVEVIISVALFAMFGLVLLMALIGSSVDSANSADRLTARYLLQEGQEALHSIRDYDWYGLSAGTHGFSDASGYWALSGSSDSFGKFTRSVALTAAGILRYDAVLTVSWTSPDGQALSTSSNQRISYWTLLKGVKVIIDTTVAYWSPFGKYLYDLILTNDTADTLVIEEIVLAWTGGAVGSRTTDIWIEGVQVWSGLGNSGDVLDIVDQTFLSGVSYDVTRIGFSKNMQSAAINITLYFDDGTSELLFIDF